MKADIGNMCRVLLAENKASKAAFQKLQAEIERLREERDALRMPAELVERATAMTEFTSLSTESWSEHMEVVLRDILAWHASLKEGKDE